MVRERGVGPAGRHDGVEYGLCLVVGSPTAHQHAAGRVKGDLQKEPPGGVGPPEPADHGLGRSRGGWTTKLHLSCEQGRKPLSIVKLFG